MMIFYIAGATLTLAVPASSASSTNAVANCPALFAKAAPTSVQDLRIDDIKVVSAIGDSITAAYSAKPIDKSSIGLGDLVENRGVSFATGGDAGAATIGNFIAHFNPNLVGRSLGSVPYNPFGFSYTPKVDVFNAAVVKAEVGDLQKQVTWLVGQIKANKKVDFVNDFKYMTLFIGGNDICNSCSKRVDPDIWANSIRAVLKTLEMKVPRLIVNIPLLFKVTELYTLILKLNSATIAGPQFSQVNASVRLWKETMVSQKELLWMSLLLSLITN